MYIKYMNDRGHWTLESEVSWVEWTYKYYTKEELDRFFDMNAEQRNFSARLEIPYLESDTESTEPPANGYRTLQLEWVNSSGPQCLLTHYRTYLLDPSGKTIENLTP